MAKGRKPAGKGKAKAKAKVETKAKPLSKEFVTSSMELLINDVGEPAVGGSNIQTAKLNVLEEGEAGKEEGGGEERDEEAEKDVAKVGDRVSGSQSVDKHHFLATHAPSVPEIPEGSPNVVDKPGLAQTKASKEPNNNGRETSDLPTPVSPPPPLQSAEGPSGLTAPPRSISQPVVTKKKPNKGLSVGPRNIGLSRNARVTHLLKEVGGRPLSYSVSGKNMAAGTAAKERVLENEASKGEGSGNKENKAP
ncbi:hypothetical protein P7C73_g2142, partial [Tremellales sp. Uapishka_1]